MKEVTYEVGHLGQIVFPADPCLDKLLHSRRLTQSWYSTVTVQTLNITPSPQLPTHVDGTRPL